MDRIKVQKEKTRKLEDKKIKTPFPSSTYAAIESYQSGLGIVAAIPDQKMIKDGTLLSIQGAYIKNAQKVFKN